MHCPTDHELCKECRVELERLRPQAETAGAHLADLLASHVVPDQPWLDTLDFTSESIVRRVEAITTDIRLRTELAKICVDAARRRWDALRQLRMRPN